MPLCQLSPLARGARLRCCFVQGKCLGHGSARRLMYQCGKKMQPGMVWGCPCCSILQKIGGSWLTVSPIPACPCEQGQKSGLSHQEGTGGGREKAETLPTWNPAPWQHREVGTGFSCDLAAGYVQGRSLSPQRHRQFCSSLLLQLRAYVITSKFASQKVKKERLKF